MVTLSLYNEFIIILGIYMIMINEMKTIIKIKIEKIIYR